MISKKLLLLLASLILAMPGIALSATTAATSSVKTDSYEITTQNGHMIVSFTFDKPLLNSTMVTMAG